MLWRYVKVQGVVLLCGGLVGPLFLTIFFAAHPRDELKWMYWAGLLVTAADILIALGLVHAAENAESKASAPRRDAD